MKPTENYEQLLKRFTKRITQVDPEDKERISYLKGCIAVSYTHLRAHET